MAQGGTTDVKRMNSIPMDQLLGWTYSSVSRMIDFLEEITMNPLGFSSNPYTKCPSQHQTREYNSN